MNQIFATAGLGGNKRFSKLTGYASSKYNDTLETHIKDEAQTGLLSGGGKLTASVNNNGVRLLLNGYLYKPLPDWKSEDGSPLDSPVTAAEYLLGRYLKLGNNFLDGVLGHFSVIISDHQASKTVFAVDPSGLNDLFYYHQPGELTVGSKVRTVAIGIDPSSHEVAVNQKDEDFFLQQGFYPQNNTVYKDVYKVPGSTVIEFNHKDGQLHKHKLLQPAPQSSSDSIKTMDQLVDRLDKKLVNSLQNLLPSKKEKVAVLLGGFDSALVASMLVQEGFDVETFSFHYDDDRFNQAHTDTVADYLGIKHNWIDVDQKTIEDGLSCFSEDFNQPTNWPSYVVQTKHLCEEISSRGFNYCYTGDGCDGLFYGYPITFKRSQVMSQIGRAPDWLLGGLTTLLERPSLERTVGRPYQVLLGVLRSAQRDETARTLLSFRIFDDLSIKQLKRDGYRIDSESIEQTVRQIASPHKGKSAVRLAYDGKGMVSPNKNKLNGSADASGMVIASPYMHAELKQFASCVPDELLRPDNSDKIVTGKFLLSKMAEKKSLLPADVIHQAKIGAADSPIEKWYEGDFGNNFIPEHLKLLPFKYDEEYARSLMRQTWFEHQYSKALSKSTNNIMTLSHCISLLATYASFNKKSS